MEAVCRGCCEHRFFHCSQDTSSTYAQQRCIHTYIGVSAIRMLRHRKAHERYFMTQHFALYEVLHLHAAAAAVHSCCAQLQLQLLQLRCVCICGCACCNIQHDRAIPVLQSRVTPLPSLLCCWNITAASIQRCTYSAVETHTALLNTEVLRSVLGPASCDARGRESRIGGAIT